MTNILENNDPLTWATGEQNAAAKAEGMTLEDWQEAQKQARPDMYFQNAGPDTGPDDEEQDG